MLKILTDPNPILRRKSQPVVGVSAKEIQELVPQMIETMIKKDGVGLAAPQVGQNIRLIVVHIKDKAQQRDTEIDELLEMQGWDVLRIPYDPPLTERALQEIMTTIRKFLGVTDDE